jgi:hypothetical protein
VVGERGGWEGRRRGEQAHASESHRLGGNLSNERVATAWLVTRLSLSHLASRRITKSFVRLN